MVDEGKGEDGAVPCLAWGSAEASRSFGSLLGGLRSKVFFPAGVSALADVRSEVEVDVLVSITSWFLRCCGATKTVMGGVLPDGLARPGWQRRHP
jgi:hypothetical protein